MEISRLQYITNYQSKLSDVEQVRQVIDGGASWVQYRPKGVDNKIVVKEGQVIANLCKKHGVTFIMNDKVDIAKVLNADGVHLGKNDMKPSEARKILGDEKIIGGTANTLSDILDLVNQGVNYIGLGPFRFTNTKKNLSPVLGIEGYESMVRQLNEKNIEIPIVAIGGINEKDVQSILNTGIYGIAVSSVISEAEDVGKKVKRFLDLRN